VLSSDSLLAYKSGQYLGKMGSYFGVVRVLVELLADVLEYALGVRVQSAGDVLF